MNHITLSLGALTDTIQNWISVVKEALGSLGMFGNILLLLLILFIGKFIVKIIGKVVTKALAKTNLDEKLSAKFGNDTNITGGIVGFVKAIAFLFILLFGLNIAGLDDVSEPIKNLLNQFFGFIPNLIVAGILGFIIVMIAGLIKQLVSDVLNASKLDERLGSTPGTTPVSGSLAIALYAFILLLCAPAVLDALGIEAISTPVKNIVNSVVAAIPKILIAGVILAIGGLIGSIAKRLVENILKGTNVDSLPAKFGMNVPTEGSRALSSIAGTVTMISIVILSLTAAIKELDIDILSQASDGLFTGYFNILVALIILTAGIVASRFAYDHLVGGNAQLAKVAKYAIVVFTSVIALDRAGLSDMTSLPFTVAIYAAGVALGIGGAIAIGLGGQDFMSRWFSKRG